jgi:membrane-bound lytic murein transglycosylase D
VTAAREKIETIAAKFKTTPQVIREANDIPPNMHVKAGSVLLVPKLATTSDKDIADEVVNNATMNVEADGPAKRRITIKVSKHDDLKSIAQRYKVTEAQIREWNDLKGKKIVAGQSLKLEVRAGKAKSKNGKAEKSEKSSRTSKSSSNKHSH